jgi:hypothetical protein
MPPTSFPASRTPDSGRHCLIEHCFQGNTEALCCRATVLILRSYLHRGIILSEPAKFNCNFPKGCTHLCCFPQEHSPQITADTKTQCRRLLKNDFCHLYPVFLVCQNCQQDTWPATLHNNRRQKKHPKPRIPKVS